MENMINKLISTFLLITLSLNTFAANPGVSGQSQAANKYPSVLKAPYNQATDLGASTSLYETGNKNRLVNPGFEHSTFSTGWTTAVTSTATITAAVETTSPLEGKKSGKYTCAGGASGGTCTIYQDVTTTQSHQGAAALYVKSDTAWNPSNSTGVQVFSRKDGVNFQSKNVDVTSDKLFSVPVTLSSVTSTGVAAVITAAASQTIIVYLDEGYVGAADLKQDFSPVGPWIDYGAMTIGAVTTAPTKGTTTTDKVRCRVSGQDYECEWTFVQTTAGTAGSGDYLFQLPTGLAFDLGYYTAYSGAGSLASTAATKLAKIQTEVSATNTVGTAFSYSGGYIYSSNQFRLYLWDSSNPGSTWNSAYMSLSNANIGSKVNIKFKGAGLASNYSAYSTTNADTDWAACTPTSYQGMGSPTSVEVFCKRQGSDLLYRGKFVQPTTTASESRVGLPLWNGVQLVSKNSTVIPSVTRVGTVSSSAVSGTYFGAAALIEPSVSYFTMGSQTSTQSETTKATGFGTTGGTFEFEARIPIEGWDNSNIIIGQFNGLESCATSAQCETEYYADISATGVVSGEEIDFINGNCALATNTFTCTYNTSQFAQAPTCKIVPGAGATQVQKITETASGFSYSLYNSGGTLTNVAASVSCRKRGTDYVVKSVRAVSSDQNIATPGTTKSTLCSAKISATGVISDHKGGCFASCTSATTPVCTFMTNFWVSGQTPNCWHIASGGNFTNESNTTTTTFSGVVTSGGTAASGARTYFCHGERQ